jgi:Ca-activated chloride channel family protein
MAGEAVEILAPRPEDYVVGEAEFRFSVSGEVERVELYAAGRLIGSASPPDWSIVYEVPDDLFGAEYVAAAFAGGELVGRASVQTASAAISEEVEVTRVLLFPAVHDRRGRYVQNLTRDDFTVWENEVPVDIRSFMSPAEVLNLGLVLDVSASMTGRLELVQDAACALVDELAPDHDLAVFSFAEDLELIAPLSRDRTTARREIRKLQAGGLTSLYDAVIRVIAYLSKAPGRKVMVLLSDGEDKSSVASMRRAVDAARKSLVSIYTIGPDRGEATALRKVLKTLARDTGGEAWFINSPRRLSSIFDDVLGQLAHQYELSYEPPPGPEGFRAVEVRVRDKRLRVKSRDEYYYRVAGPGGPQSR